jgi:drug/metabolite transporter (DMT)-like permease
VLPSLLTALFFALSTLFAQRSIKAVGSTRANIGRLVVAYVVLGVYAHLLGNGMGGVGRNWLLLSGVVGMGLGDLAFFFALPRVGSRLTVLITQCLAAPIAAVVDWLWLGTNITSPQILFGLVILAGVGIALMPSKSSPPHVQLRASGFLYALAAAGGQGLGAVISRKAKLCATLAGENIDGITAAYQRIAGGLIITLAYFAVAALLQKSNSPFLPKPVPSSALRTWGSYLWIPVNATCGAILGVSCYQWALFTTPSAIVMPIVATTPLVIIPFTYWFEGERPSRRSLLGGLLAVAGAVGLALAR